MSAMRRGLWIAAGLVLVGLPFRIKALKGVESRAPVYEDVDDYRAAARTVHPIGFLKTGRLQDLYRHSRPPLFPAVLRAVQAVFGDSRTVSFRLTFVLGLFVAPLAFLVGRRLVGEEPAALASLWVAVNPGLSYIAASGISIELFTLIWLLFLDRVRPGVPPTRGRLVGAAVAAAAATLVRFEAAVVAAGILAVVWSGWRRWIPALLPVLLLVLFSVATGNAFSYRHGHFMYYTEFLKGSGIPIESFPYDMTYFDYLFKHHSWGQILLTPFRGMATLLVSLDALAGLPGLACLALAGACGVGRGLPPRWMATVAVAGMIVPAVHLPVTSDAYTFYLPHLLPLLWLAAVPVARVLRLEELRWKAVAGLVAIVPCAFGWALVDGWPARIESLWTRLP